jgi:hypothetical protein
MKVFARKQRELLSMVPPKTERERPDFAVNPSALEESFDGWLNSVSVLSKEPELPVPASYRIPRLTALDVSRVNQATIREGESHCIWPPTVVQQFTRADVIKTGEVEHYALRDVNLTRVEHKKRRQSKVPSAFLQMLAERE